MADATQTALEDTSKDEEITQSQPLDQTELEDVVGGRGPEREPAPRIPDGWGQPDPDNPWSIP